ncbi:MAG: glycosyltransferase family 1 protein [Chloroflexota bacterium]
MKIAIFTETFLPKMDGIVRVICLLVDHLCENGHEVLIVSPNLSEDSTRRVDEYNGCKVIALEGIPLPWYPEVKFTGPSLRVYRELQAFDPDVAHFFHPVTVGLPGLAMAKRLDIPTLISFHLDFARLARHMNYGPINLGFMENIADTMTRMVFNWGDYTLAPSKQVQSDMLNLGIKDVGLWKRGVDIDRFHPNFYDAEMRDVLTDGNPDDTLLLYVGRLSKEKHIHDLLPLMQALPDVRLALVGDGPYSDELREMFAGTKTVFTGHISGETLSKAYASGNIFVFPSSLETFGLVVVEAMAAGLPVVASRVGGIPDVVKESYNGYTFDVGDTQAIIEGVKRISTSRETMQQMGRNGRHFAETQTWGHMMDEVIEHYQRIIDEYEKMPTAEVSY